MGGGCKKQRCFWEEMQDVAVLMEEAARSRGGLGGGCKKQSWCFWEEMQEVEVFLKKAA